MPRKGGVKENLKPPWKPGESGNPKGRPKLPDLKQAIAKVLNEEKDGEVELQNILNALKKKALKGDVRAAQELLDRGYGKSQQFIEHTIPSDTVYNINIIDAGKGD